MEHLTPPYHSTNGEREASSGFCPLQGVWSVLLESRAEGQTSSISLYYSSWQPNLSRVSHLCRSSPGTSSLTCKEQSCAGASQAGLVTRTIFYLNPTSLQGCCLWSCKGETPRIRNKSNLATCEFWKDVWRFFSSAAYRRESEQQRAEFKPELNDF